MPVQTSRHGFRSMHGIGIDHVVIRCLLDRRPRWPRPQRRDRSASAPLRHDEGRVAPRQRRVRLGAGKQDEPLLPSADDAIAELPEVSTATDPGKVTSPLLQG